MEAGTKRGGVVVAAAIIPRQQRCSEDPATLLAGSRRGVQSAKEQLGDMEWTRRSFFATGSLGEARWRVFCVQMERRFGSEGGGVQGRECKRRRGRGRLWVTFFFPCVQCPFWGGEIWTGQSVLGLMEGAVGQLQHARCKVGRRSPKNSDPPEPHMESHQSSRGVWKIYRHSKETEGEERKKKGGGYYFFCVGGESTSGKKKNSKKNSGWWGGSRLANRYCARYIAKVPT